MNLARRLLLPLLLTLLLPAASQAAAAWQPEALRRSSLGMVASLPEAWRPEVVRFLGSPAPDPGRLLAALSPAGATGAAPAIPAAEAERDLSLLRERLGASSPSAAALYDHAERLQLLESLLGKALPPARLPQLKVAAQLARDAVAPELRPKLEARARDFARLLAGYQAPGADAPAPAVVAAAAKDLPGVLAIERRSFPKEDRWPAAEFRAGLADPKVALKVVKAKGRVAAVSMTTLSGGRLYIDDVATHPDHRRRGYAAALLRDAIQAALDDPSVRTIALHVEAANKAAIALYEDFGFAVKRRVKAYYESGRDALLMSFTVRAPAEAPALAPREITDLAEMTEILQRLKTSTPGKLDGARIMIKYRVSRPPTAQALAEAEGARQAGFALDVFTGVLTTVARNARGQLYFRMVTLERTDGQGRYRPRAFNTVEGKLLSLKVLDAGS